VTVKRSGVDTKLGSKPNQFLQAYYQELQAPCIRYSLCKNTLNLPVLCCETARRKLYIYLDTKNDQYYINRLHGKLAREAFDILFVAVTANDNGTLVSERQQVYGGKHQEVCPVSVAGVTTSSPTAEALFTFERMELLTFSDQDLVTSRLAIFGTTSKKPG
jgi:hypothetical protein